MAGTALTLPGHTHAGPQLRLRPRRSAHAISCAGGVRDPPRQAPESTVSQPCGSLSAGNIRRIFGGIFEMLCVKWFTSVDSRQRSTVELNAKAVFSAVDSRDGCGTPHARDARRGGVACVAYTGNGSLVWPNRKYGARLDQ
eukprot:3531623-Pyramimonas_sp.AAC.2